MHHSKKIASLLTLTVLILSACSPGQTATPTPVPYAPSLLFPTNNATIPRNQSVVLQWVAIQPLQGKQHYLVVVRNLGTDEEFLITTRNNVYRLPGDWQPGAGKSVQFEWSVVIVSGSEPDSPVISSQGSTWGFTWGS